MAFKCDVKFFALRMNYEDSHGAFIDINIEDAYDDVRIKRSKT